MARVVKHDAQAPYEIPAGTELPIYICGCGLSKNKPYCDGSHKKTRAEAAGEVYEYDENGAARLVAKH
jgi:CDGSH-type Zn-finger protein